MSMLFLAPILGIPLALEFIHLDITKKAAFEEARRLSNGRGIINIGAGPHRSAWAHEVSEFPDVLVNLDIVPDGMPNFLQLDIESSPLPFRDKQFGCVLASHVLEHLDNWEFALAEMVRVADYVVVVLPSPIYFSGWVWPEHKQHFSTDDINTLAQRYSNVVVYC